MFGNSSSAVWPTGTCAVTTLRSRPEHATRCMRIGQHDVIAHQTEIEIQADRDIEEKQICTCSALTTCMLAPSTRGTCWERMSASASLLVGSVHVLLPAHVASRRWSSKGSKHNPRSYVVAQSSTWVALADANRTRVMTPDTISEPLEGHNKGGVACGTCVPLPHVTCACVIWLSWPRLRDNVRSTEEQQQQS